MPPFSCQKRSDDIGRILPNKTSPSHLLSSRFAVRWEEQGLNGFGGRSIIPRTARIHNAPLPGGSAGERSLGALARE